MNKEVFFMSIYDLLFLASDEGFELLIEWYKEITPHVLYIFWIYTYTFFIGIVL